MSGYAKGMRKPKSGGIRNITIGGYSIRPELAIVALLSALYVLFLAGGRLEGGLDSLILCIFAFIAFALFAYIVRTPGFCRLKPFMLLIDAFLVLSALTLIGALAVYLNLFGAAVNKGISWLAFTQMINAVLTAIALFVVLYVEKGDMEDIFLKGCPLKSATIGLAILIVCALLAVGIAYLFLGGAVAKSGGLFLAALNIILFGLMGGIYEEALFRGLLLSRLQQVIGDSYSLPAQAIIFAFFEAVAVYAFVPNLLVLLAMFVVGAILGYYWGRITIENESILVPQLTHAGLYMLIALLVLASMA